MEGNKLIVSQRALKSDSKEARVPETTFYNMWRTNNAGDRSALVERMNAEAPAMAAKPGFVSMTVLECEEDGRVLVEGRWQPKDAFDAAVSNDPEAQKSRLSLREFGSPEPGLFRKTFRVLSAKAKKEDRNAGQAVIEVNPESVTYVQIWRMNSAQDQPRWLETMHSRIGLLTVQPGFLSMTLHTSLDGRQTAAYAQWSDEASLTVAINLPEAKGSHDEMAQWGTPEGSLYRVESVYLQAATDKERK